MRAIRLVIAALIGVALVIVPVSAAFAKPVAAHAEMSASAPADACPCCCDQTHNGAAANVCSLKCCSGAAILVEVQELTRPLTTSDAEVVTSVPSPFSRAPDPPPPRA